MRSRSLTRRQTSLQRRGYGPVYLLDLDDTELSDCYNPLAAIRPEPAFTWEDALSFSNLLHTKRINDREPFFSTASVNLVAAAAAYVVLCQPEARRNVETMLAIVAGVGWDAFLREGKARADVPSLRNETTGLSLTDEKTLKNVRTTARGTLSAFEGFSVSRITRISDWRPEALRRQNATLYVRFSLDKMESYAGFVRVIVGQHLRALLREPVDRSTPWFQLFLDELPQLQKLDVIQQTLDAGRNQHIRLWMFMQYQSQLEAIYGETIARGMIGACHVRAFMNPSPFDGTAEQLSKAIGTELNTCDGSRRPVVEPHVLAGADDVLVFPMGGSPVRLRKHFMHRDATLSGLAGELP